MSLVHHISSRFVAEINITLKEIIFVATVVEKCIQVH